MTYENVLLKDLSDDAKKIRWDWTVHIQNVILQLHQLAEECVLRVVVPLIKNRYFYFMPPLIPIFLVFS